MLKLQHKAQRVAVFFDVQNLYYSAKHIYNKKVNFAKILEIAVANRSLVRAISYVIKADIKEENNFHSALESIGIEVKSKELQTFFGGHKKGDWDIGIAMDAIRSAQKVDTVVLVSGDGDFKDLVLYLQSMGCRVEVIAFSKTGSIHLKDTADLFIDLGKYAERVLIPDRSSQRPQENNHVKPKEHTTVIESNEARLPELNVNKRYDSEDKREEIKKVKKVKKKEEIKEEKKEHKSKIKSILTKLKMKKDED